MFGVCLARGVGKISFLTAIALDYKFLTNITPPQPAPGLNCTSQMLLSDDPHYLCPMSGVRLYQSEARIGDCTIIVSLGFDEQLDGLSIVEFLHLINAFLF